jgi:GDP-L-fucose synthase
VKILVTGGTGFLGQHVMDELQRRGHDAKALSRKDADLTLYDDMDGIHYCGGRPDAIIHLAAKCGGIGANMDRPGDFFRDNMLMGINIIDEANAIGVKKLVVAGTVCAYPKFTPVPFKEEDLWNGFPESTNAPYGVAKKALLVMLQAYRQQYGLNGIYLIPVNLYGPGDHFDLRTSHVIPALIRKFHEAKTENKPFVECWGTGSASREFLYVEDAAKGLVDGLERYDGADPVNLGSGKEIMIRDLAEKVKGIVGFEGGIKWDASKPDGQPRRCLDTSKAKDLFGFEAQTDFDEGLRKTYEWYLKEIS